ncbi:MAG: hypothetical protein AAFU64_16400, partial [Bacteroidota bacterium]
MNNRELVLNIVLFFVYVIIQVFFAKNLELFGLAFCFLYINYILLLPIDMSRMVFLLIAFAMGFLIDLFYDTLGMHAAALVLIAYLRPFVISIVSSKNEIFEISLKETGLRWFLSYLSVMIFIHHLLLFLLQQFSFRLIFKTLLKTGAST